MERVALSKRYSVVIPRRIRKSLRLRPGMKLSVTLREGVIVLEAPMRAYRGIARGADVSGLRDKTDRF